MRLHRICKSFFRRSRDTQPETDTSNIRDKHYLGKARKVSKNISFIMVLLTAGLITLFCGILLGIIENDEAVMNSTALHSDDATATDLVNEDEMPSTQERKTSSSQTVFKPENSAKREEFKNEGTSSFMVMKKGVLGITSNEIQHRQKAAPGFTSSEGIESLMEGGGGLKSGGSGGVGRKGMAGIGYGAGYGSGFGGGSHDMISFSRGASRIVCDLLEPAGTINRNEIPVSWKRSGIAGNTSRLFIGDKDTLPLHGTQYSVKIDGFRARVLIDCYYYNNRERIMEGTFKLSLPNGAKPYFFAFGETILMGHDNSMKIPFIPRIAKSDMQLSPADIMEIRNSTWRQPKEARIVPKEKAAFAYTETVRRRVDPALAEWAGADVFNCRVFPLQPYKMHRIVIGYDCNLVTTGDSVSLNLSVPQTGRPVIVDFDVSDIPGSAFSLCPQTDQETVGKKRYFHYENPSSDEIIVSCTRVRPYYLSTKADAWQPFFALPYYIQLPRINEEYSGQQTVFCIDISLSSNRDKFNVWLKLAMQILENNTDIIKKFNVLFFNIETIWLENNYIENNKENRQRFLNFANDLALEGATDLKTAISEAANPVWQKPGKKITQNIFLLSDGSVTWGNDNSMAICAPVGKENRVYTFTTGASGTNTEIVQKLARESGGALFTVTSDAQILAASTAFRSKSWRIENVTIKGASDILIAGDPKNLFNGQCLLITGRGTLNTSPVLDIAISNGTRIEHISEKFDYSIPSELTERIYGQIAVEQLEEYSDLTERYAKGYATRFRIPGKTCSLLMLDTETDYARFQIKTGETTALVIQNPITRILQDLKQRQYATLFSAKREFLSWLKKLKKANGVAYTMPTVLELALKELPENEFKIRCKPIRCSAHNKIDLSDTYLAELSKDELDYDTILNESTRRHARQTPHDALKALSSLIENNPGNIVLLKDIAYSALEMQIDDQAYYLFKKVIESRPFEPHAFHAIAQILTKMGNYDLAGIYYEILMNADWNERYRDFKKIAALDYLHYIRHIQNTAKKVALKEYFDEQYAQLRNYFPYATADLIVTITWNTDNSDVDLHVTEPNGEECFYKNARTAIGGTITRDVIDGYGPEMYVLRNSIPGKYAINALYFSSNRNQSDVRTKIYSTVYENWGTAQEKITKRVVVLKTTKDTQELFAVAMKKG